MREFDWLHESVRLEPANRSYGVGEGVASRVKDPLWMIGRAWTMGEFRASNGGHPVAAETGYRTQTLDVLGRGAEQPESIQVNTPLEPLVEAEAGGDSPAWDPRRLEYDFFVRGGDTRLHGREYDGDRLDWYSFDLDEAGDLEGERRSAVTAPRPVRYEGMPLPRWWSFEDARVELGTVDRPYLNVLTMALIEFGLVYSHDWFLLPVPHRAGDVRRIVDLRVVDTFGVVTVADPVQDEGDDAAGFEIFTLAAEDGGDPSLFYLPNNLWHSLEGPPLEHVSLRRDEVGNLVWATEHRVDGISLDDAETVPDPPEPTHYWDGSALVPRPDPMPEDEPGNTLEGPVAVYDEEHLPPRNSIPYERQLRDDRPMLRRARVYADGPQYRGRIVEESKLLHEEEVTRTGIVVSRVHQLARAADGRAIAWLGRKKRPAPPRKPRRPEFDRLREPHDPS